MGGLRGPFKTVGLKKKLCCVVFVLDALTMVFRQEDSNGCAYGNFRAYDIGCAYDH